MNYAQIRSMDISNGEGVGVSIFVQGCPIHCKGCFNSEAWDFNGGKEWTEEKKNMLLELLNKPYISRFSVLGGEPLAKQNMQDICKLCKEIKDKFPEKKIWLYSGYQYESLSREQFKVLFFVDVSRSRTAASMFRVSLPSATNTYVSCGSVCTSSRNSRLSSRIPAWMRISYWASPGMRRPLCWRSISSGQR